MWTGVERGVVLRCVVVEKAPGNLLGAINRTVIGVQYSVGLKYRVVHGM